jgi:hypothetical protein
MDISGKAFLNGNVYNMKNIVNNLNYANAMSAYDKTGNLQTLETIIRSQIKLTDETINKFSAGAFYDNIINTQKAVEYLKDFYESLKNAKCDTILTSLRKELMQQLSWIDYSDQSFMKLVLCKSRMETAMSNNNYFQALINGYEGYKFISKCISKQLKAYINSNGSSENTATGDNYITLIDRLKSRKKDNFQKIDKNVNNEKRKIDEKEKYQSFLDPKSKFDFNKDNNYIENEILRRISKLWLKIKNNRNNCAHKSEENASMEEIHLCLDKTVKFFDEIINRHKKNGADNIELKLFTLI